MAADLVIPAYAAEGPALAGIPVAFILFALTLAGIAIFHRHTLRVALAGLAVVTVYKLIFTTFDGVPGLAGLAAHLVHEWVVLSNLFGLLVGFALLADHFEKSHVPELLPAILPDDWRGGVMLLALVFVLSAIRRRVCGWTGRDLPSSASCWPPSSRPTSSQQLV